MKFSITQFLFLTLGDRPRRSDRFSNHCRITAPWSATVWAKMACVFIAWFSMGLVGVTSGQESNASQAQESATPKSIEQLIQGLSASSYQVREASGDALVQCGPLAVKGLATELIDAPPETQWRIKNVLRKIASSYDTQTLFKAMAILKLRFRDIDVTNLKRKWQNSKRKEAIAQLRSLGMQVVEHGGGGFNGWVNGRANINGLNVIRVAPDNLILNREFGPVELFEAEQATPEVVTEELRSPTAAELRKEFAEILDASVDENRKRVFAGVSVKTPNQNPYQASAWPQPGVRVTFDKRWAGTLDDLEALDVLNLSLVSFDSIELDPKMLNRVLAFAPDSLSFRDCRIKPSDQLLEAESMQLQMLSISKVTTEEAGELMKVLANASVQHLELSLDRSDVDLFSKVGSWTKSVRSLELAGMKLSQASFDSLKEMKQLRSLMLSGCRFQINDYREFQKERSDVRMDFLAVAFLGVSGARLGSRRLEIIRVVDGSAAHTAGVEVGDLILAVGGQEVDDFEDLRLLIAQYGIGDTIEIDVSRDGQVIELSAKLKPNDQPQVLR